MELDNDRRHMTRRAPMKPFLIVQTFVVLAFGAALTLHYAQARILPNRSAPPDANLALGIPVLRTEPLRVLPLYDRPDLISDADLAAVLEQIHPRFPLEHRKPNHIEHALRTWGVRATFQDPTVLSGEEMLRFLTDHAAFMESWGETVRPLLEDRPEGIAIRWGKEPGASVHHDHLLACVTEAGAPLETPVFGPTQREMTLSHVIQEALRDFRLDERETEWTAMAFGLWIPETREWIGAGGRRYSYDLLVHRLLRGHQQLGVCNGTHRVYSLMLLVRLDEEYNMLSMDTREIAIAHLKRVRDLITECQFEDGHWPSNWPDGRSALETPIEDELYQQVITTGHHLEWLSLAPPELHPPAEMIAKATDWVIQATLSQTPDEIRERYTFFSHVGSALANWRNTHPADFWKTWEEQHPFASTSDEVSHEGTKSQRK